MTSNYTNKYGTITINDSVIANIASEAAMSSYGIVGLAYRNATDGLMTLLKKKICQKELELRVILMA